MTSRVALNSVRKDAILASLFDPLKLAPLTLVEANVPLPVQVNRHRTSGILGSAQRGRRGRRSMATISGLCSFQFGRSHAGMLRSASGGERCAPSGTAKATANLPDEERRLKDQIPSEIEAEKSQHEARRVRTVDYITLRPEGRQEVWKDIAGALHSCSFSKTISTLGERHTVFSVFGGAILPPSIH